MIKFDETVDRKTLWRQSRMLLWSLIVTLAVFALFSVAPPAAAGWEMTFWLLKFVATWIVAYHGLEFLKKRS